MAGAGRQAVRQVIHGAASLCAHPATVSPAPAGSLFAAASQDGSTAVWDHRSTAVVARFLTPLVRCYCV